ncbi:hypothetical protein C2S52_001215 [Perilla frutescens var. hirtella]|nr:hypothetical protein C2S52_001215 [Perilla frutescens var. hirtella]
MHTARDIMYTLLLPKISNLIYEKISPIDKSRIGIVGTGERDEVAKWAALVAPLEAVAVPLEVLGSAADWSAGTGDLLSVSAAIIGWSIHLGSPLNARIETRLTWAGSGFSSSISSTDGPSRDCRSSPAISTSSSSSILADPAHYARKGKELAYSDTELESVPILGICDITRHVPFLVCYPMADSAVPNGSDCSGSVQTNCAQVCRRRRLVSNPWCPHWHRIRGTSASLFKLPLNYRGIVNNGHNTGEVLQLDFTGNVRVHAFDVLVDCSYQCLFLANSVHCSL